MSAQQQSNTFDEALQRQLAPVVKRADDHAAVIEELREGQRVLTNLLERLTSVTVGDKDFKQLGLVDQVREHEKFIKNLDTQIQQAIGSYKTIVASVRTLLFIGGGIITVIQLLIQAVSYLLRNAS